MRFYLTTAIDYVNSRPHLGTAYEKISADVIARYKRLCRVRDAFPHGQRRAFPERVQARARARHGSARGTATRWSRSSVRSGSSSTSRSMTSSGPPSRATVPLCSNSRRRAMTTATSTRAIYEGWYCVALRGVQAGEGPRGRQVPAPSDGDAGVDSREELFLPPVQVPRSAAGALSGASRVPGARRAAQRDPAPRRSGARGYLREPRRSALGHSAALCSATTWSTSGSTR